MERINLDIPDSGSGFRTFFIFSNIPIHIELFGGFLPLFSPGTQAEFNIQVKDPRNHRHEFPVVGLFEVSSRKLIYQTEISRKTGFSQYIEWSLVSLAEVPNRPQ